MPLSAALRQELSILPPRPKIMVVGEPDTGKSTLVTALARWFRNRSQQVAVVDSDTGQSDLGPPGFVSYGIMKEDVASLQLIANKGSYLVGKTSPYGRELSLVTGTKLCIEAARHQGANVILIDTCGLVRPARGVQLKRAKAGIVKPDLILTLSTPGLVPLVDCLNLLGFHVRNFLPLKEARTRSADERRAYRISRWNAYLGNNPSRLAVHQSRTTIRRWHDGSRYENMEQIPPGTVVAVRNPQAPEFQIPGIWAVAKGSPFLLAPRLQKHEENTIWVTTYQLELDGNTVISA